MNWNDISEALSHLTEPTYLYAAGAIVLLIVILVLLARRQPRKIVAYRTKNGRVMVRRSAIVGLIRSSCEQLEHVAKPTVRIKVKGKTTHFEVYIQLMSGGHLREIEETLQAHLRQSLTDNLGMENLGKINIVATNFKSGRIQSPHSVTQTEKTNFAALDTIDPAKDSETVEANSNEAPENALDPKQL
jgi:hypothetical protein